jgi:glycosyltransferase involved in cell wall biosynthesis
VGRKNLLNQGIEGGTHSRQHTTPAKILFVTPFSWLYGEALSLLQLVRSLDRSQYSPTVITTGDGPLVAQLREVDIPVHSIRMPYLSRRGKQAFDFAFSLMPVSLKISNFIRSEKFDLVYNNTLLNPYGAFASYLAGVPCVWHVREVGKDSSLRRNFIKLTALLATRLVVVSKSVQELYSEDEMDKVQVVYNGIDPDYFDPGMYDAREIRTAYGIRPDQPVISMIARMHPSKHHDHLLSAVSRLAETWPDLMVLLVGDGPEEETIKEQIIQLGLKENVRMLGYMEDVREVLAASDLFVLPSEHEAFGRAVVEAMLMEKPVVATAVGGLPELISPDTGLLVPAGCPEELGNAIRFIISEREKGMRMGQQGRERALACFSLNRYIKEMRSVFDELL